MYRQALNRSARRVPHPALPVARQLAFAMLLTVLMVFSALSPANAQPSHATQESGLLLVLHRLHRPTLMPTAAVVVQDSTYISQEARHESR
jgi:hypothetical protein